MRTAMRALTIATYLAAAVIFATAVAWAIEIVKRIP